MPSHDQSPVEHHREETHRVGLVEIILLTMLLLFATVASSGSLSQDVAASAECWTSQLNCHQ